jgi:hypothetical protein
LEYATGYYAFRIMDWNSYGLVGLEHVIALIIYQKKNGYIHLERPFKKSDVRPYSTPLRKSLFDSTFKMKQFVMTETQSIQACKI